MKVYLASWYASRDEMNVRAYQLREAGIEVTSRWLEEDVKPTTAIKEVSEDFLRETARIDIQDILLADTVVLNTPSSGDLARTDMAISTWARGGRHFEAGFQYATMLLFNTRKLILVGHRENVFHYLDGIGDSTVVSNGLKTKLPEIQLFGTWDEARDYLIQQQSCAATV